jgi:hypothetical protein
VIMIIIGVQLRNDKKNKVIKFVLHKSDNSNNIIFGVYGRYIKSLSLHKYINSIKNNIKTRIVYASNIILIIVV